MATNSQGELPIDPYEDVALELYQREQFNTLPNSTCRNSLHEIVFEVWKSLLYQYAHDGGRREPSREDALRAFTRVKSHLITRRLPTIPHSFLDWLAYVWDVYPREQKWKTVAILGAIVSSIFLAGFTVAAFMSA